MQQKQKRTYLGIAVICLLISVVTINHFILKREVSRESIGTITDIRPIEYQHKLCTQIETELVCVIISGNPKVTMGATAWLVKYNNSSHGITWENTETTYELYQ
jgi:hypothetical protein